MVTDRHDTNMDVGTSRPSARPSSAGHRSSFASPAVWHRPASARANMHMKAGGEAHIDLSVLYGVAGTSGSPSSTVQTPVKDAHSSPRIVPRFATHANTQQLVYRPSPALLSMGTSDRLHRTVQLEQNLVSSPRPAPVKRREPVVTGPMIGGIDGRNVNGELRTEVHFLSCTCPHAMQRVAIHVVEISPYRGAREQHETPYSRNMTTTFPLAVGFARTGSAAAGGGQATQ